MWALHLIAAATIAAGAAPAHAGDARRLLRYLPADAALVAGVDVARARRTPLATAIAPRFLASDRGARLVAAVIDPVKDVDTVLASLAAGDAFQAGRAFVVLEGRFARLSPERLFTDPAHAATRGGIVYWTDDTSAAAVIGNRLLLGDLARVELAIDAAAAPAPRAAGVRALARAVDPRHHAWAAWQLDTASRILARAKGVEADAITVGLTSPGDVALELRARLPDPSSAEASVAKLREALASTVAGLPARGLGSLADTFAVVAAAAGDEAIARVTATVRRGEIAAFVTALGDLLRW